MNKNVETTVLLADDDASIRLVVAKFLSNQGYVVRATDNVHTLLRWLQQGEGDVVVSDVHMGVDNVFSFIPKIKHLRPDIPIIIISANTSVITALKSKKSKVFEYIPKPFDLENISDTITRATLNTGQEQPARFKAVSQIMVGKSQIMQPVFKSIADHVSGHGAVYIFGDSGTGKTLCANILHEQGRRKHLPLVYAHTPLETDELRDQGFVGDVLIERIHELDASNQLYLLRLLEDLERNSADEKMRIIVTSNVSLNDLLAQDDIREDMLFHFLGSEIYLPPLIERADDFEDLVHYFLGQESGATQTVQPEAMRLMKQHTYPGNIRELKLLLSRLSKTYKDRELSTAMIESIFKQQTESEMSLSPHNFRGAKVREHCRSLLLSTDKILANTSRYTVALSWVEKPLIEEALILCGGNASKAAELLGIHRNTLRTKIKSLGIS